MTNLQGTIVVVYLIALFIQSERIISLLKEIRENLEEEQE